MNIVAQQVEQLLTDPGFRNFAAAACQKIGIPIPAGEDPAAVLLLRVHQHAPQAFAGFVSQAHGIRESEAARAVQPAQATANQQALREQFAKAVPEARVVKMWNALPAGSPLRAKAKSPGVNQLAQEALSKAGWEALPGLTAGESIVAYLHAIGSTPSLQRAGVFRELAEATGEAFGSEVELRSAARYVVGEQQRADRQAGTDEMSKAIGDQQRQSAQDLRRQRGEPLAREAKEQDARANPKFMVPNQAPTDGKAAAQRKSTRDTVAEVFADKAKAGPERVYAQNRNQFYGHMLTRKLAGESMEGLEMAPHLRREFTKELRDQGYRVDEVVGSGSTGAGDISHGPAGDRSNE